METLILTFPCKPSAGKVLLEAFATALSDTRAFPGCISVTRDSQMKYMQWRAETGMPEQLGPLLAGPLKEEWLVAHSI